MDLELIYFQSNIEGELIDKIQEFGFRYDGIFQCRCVYTHLHRDSDAVKAITTPVVEVHFRTPTPAKVSDTNPISLVMQKELF
jgi:3-dehydroquinate dehydratase